MLRGGPKKKKPHDPVFPVTYHVMFKRQVNKKPMVVLDGIEGNKLAIMYATIFRLKAAFMPTSIKKFKRATERVWFMSMDEIMEEVRKYCTVKGEICQGSITKIPRQLTQGRLGKGFKKEKIGKLIGRHF